MLTPFEELEFLADYLPEEGEAVLILREAGELRCEPVHSEDLRDGINDAELYGILVQANERLNAEGGLPLWVTSIGVALTTMLLFLFAGFGWQQWLIVPMIGLLAIFGCFQWIRRRQHVLFENEILPRIHSALIRRGISPYSLMAGVRQHAEFRTLLDELVRWQPSRRYPQEGL